jgi:Carbohydrate binding domain
MEISLHSGVRKISWLVAVLVLAAVYVAITGREYLAEYFGSKSDLTSLRRAIALEPRNSDYRYLLGRYFWVVDRNPDNAAVAYREAVSLNPHSARYWLDLAAVYQFLGNTVGQLDALEHAVLADPTTPDVAWETANLYAVEGATDKALREFRVVLQNDPYMPPEALQICWRIQPDIDLLLRDIVPRMASVYSSFLEFLITKKETAAAAKVWEQMAQLHQPVEKRYLFQYMNYLVLNQQPDQARLVWQQAAEPCNISGYEQTSQNLVVNGDFSLPVLNGGFDWRYQQTPDVSLALDPTQFHAGNRSLSLIFDSRGIEDAGIRQLIPVQPNTGYDFSAFFKADSIEGAGGPRFAIQDPYTAATYFTSEELKDADFWKQVSGEFVTGPDTKLLLLRIQRVPAGNAIKGRLWIDNVRLVRKPSQG